MDSRRDVVLELSSAASSFRLGMDGQAGASLARAIDGILAGAVGGEATVARLAPLFAELLAAQERGDGIGLADRLEHGLLPALGIPLPRELPDA